MISSFKAIIEEAKALEGTTISVAAAHDRGVLEAIKEAYDQGIAQAILVGDEGRIRPMAEAIGLPSQIRIIHEPDEDEAALKAVELIRQGEAHVYMKGALGSGPYLRAALHREKGLRRGRILSMLAAHEIEGLGKLLFVSDGGVNIAPSVDEKMEILANSVEALNALGIARPKVAVLAANEVVSPKMPVTVDSKDLVDRIRGGEGGLSCLVEGPMAIDVAASRQAAEIKGIDSEVAGDADLFLVPDIEAGNILGKALVIYAKAKSAGLILGATHPMVMTSRSESAKVKMNSIALACLVAMKSL